MSKKVILLTSLVCILLIVLLIGGNTLAKYISTINGSGNAKIAKWSFNSTLKNNGTLATENTILLQNTYDTETLTEGKIAPGTSGNFDIEIDATGSDVGISYEVKFIEQEGKEVKPTNLKFSIDNGETYYSSIHDLEDELKGIINADDKSKIKTINIKWLWPYETGEDLEILENDKIDTLQGKTIEEYTFSIEIIGIQIIPN